MITESEILYFIVSILLVEGVIYCWSVWTSKQEEGNYFAIPRKLIFEKCARNSGRVSAILNLIILLMIGKLGLKQIYAEKSTWDIFFNLVTAFAINHFIHFLFLFQNFKRKSKTISLSKEKHGFVTFVCILLFPMVLWYFINLNWVLYTCIVLHLLNVSFAFVHVLSNKIRVKSKITYHNRMGIMATMLAWVLIVYRVFVEI